MTTWLMAYGFVASLVAVGTFYFTFNELEQWGWEGFWLSLLIAVVIGTFWIGYLVIGGGAWIYDRVRKS